jgi:probable F420-dependent oxidoreductase
MKLGVQLSPPSQFPDLELLVDFVVRAEDAGYDFVCLPEHTIMPARYEETMGRQWPDPVTVAAFLAARTSTIRFIFYILIVPQHDPIRLAKQLATLDVLSRGRVDVGVGLGWVVEEMEWVGKPFHRRGARAEEYVEAMRTLWTTDPSTFEGEWVSFSGASFHPKPMQQPLPVWIGGSWRHSALRAGRVGDGWMPMQATTEQLQEGRGLLARELRARRRDPETFPVMLRIPLYEPSPRATSHAVSAGGTAMEYLQGDVERAIRYVDERAAEGVTHLWVSLPEVYPRVAEEMEAFASELRCRGTVDPVGS